MERYEIVMTPDAMEDLAVLRDYIRDRLGSAGTALNYIRTVRQEIGSLDVMPERFALLSEEPWHSRGLRRMVVKNFFVYYRLDKEAKRIYILNVIYARREQLRALEEREQQG